MVGCCVLFVCFLGGSYNFQMRKLFVETIYVYTGIGVSAISERSEG